MEKNLIVKKLKSEELSCSNNLTYNLNFKLK